MCGGVLRYVEDGGGVADELVDERRSEGRGSSSAGATFDELAFTCRSPKTLEWRRMMRRDDSPMA